MDNYRWASLFLINYIFGNEQKFSWTLVSFRKKTMMDEWLDCSEKWLDDRFLKNEGFEIVCAWQFFFVFFTKRTNGFWNKLIKKQKFFLLNELLKNESFYLKNNFTEPTILLNNRFYWTIIQRENEQNRWKMKDNFKNKQIQYFND